MVSFLRSLRATALAAALLTPTLAGAEMAIEGKPKVTFFATGSPGFMSIEGVSNALRLTDDGATLVFTVPMDSVDSGIPLRDDHMNKNYVQTGTFPDAVISLTRAAVSWPAELGKSTEGTAAATFTVHGVTQPTTVAYTATKTKTGFRVKARFDYDCNAHGMVIESYMGISFDPKMYATVTVDLVDAP